MSAVTTLAGSAWVTRAACRDHDPDLFYVTSEAGIAAARQICRSCPVALACLREALEHTEGYGVRGGLTLRQRNRLMLHDGRIVKRPPRPSGKRCARCGGPIPADKARHHRVLYCSDQCKRAVFNDKRGGRCG